MANKLLGQHFLTNDQAIRKIIAALAPEKGDVIFEIGPGHGELTALLAEKCAPLDCTITAIEKDEALADELEKRALKNVRVAKGDVLEMIPLITDKNYKLVGNIPYYLTGHLLRVVSELANKPKLAVFMVQKEVAERMISAPPDMNRLAASIQFFADITIIGNVPKEDFSPQPKVDSSIVRFKTRSDPEKVSADRYYDAVRKIFAQPRKTILNNVTAAFLENKPGKEIISEKLSSLGIDPTARPQNMTVKDISNLAREELWG